MNQNQLWSMKDPLWHGGQLRRATPSPLPDISHYSLYNLAGVGGRESRDGETGGREWGDGGVGGVLDGNLEFPGGNVSTEKK